MRLEVQGQTYQLILDAGFFELLGRSVPLEALAGRLERTETVELVAQLGLVRGWQVHREPPACPARPEVAGAVRAAGVDEVLEALRPELLDALTLFRAGHLATAKREWR